MTPREELEQLRAEARRKGLDVGKGGGSTPTIAPTPTNVPEASKSFQRAGDYGATMAGVADAGVRAYIGAKDFLGTVIPPYGRDRQESGDKALSDAIIREQEAEAEADPEGFKRAVGQAGANIALTAIPAAKAAQLTKTLGAIGSTAGISGAQGLLLNPAKGDTWSETALNKLGGAGVDALWGTGLSLGGNFLKKTVGGMFQPTAEAVDLMKQGVTPTLQQGAESWLGRTVGGLSSGLKSVETRQGKEVLDAYLKKVAPNLNLSDMNVPEKINLLRQHFFGDPIAGTRGAFGDVLEGKKYTLGPTERSAIWGAARGPRGTQPEATQLATRAMSGTGTAMQGKTPVTMGASKMTEYRNLIQDQIDKFGTGTVMERQAKENLIAAKNMYDRLVRDPALSTAEKAELADINSRYANFLRFQSAAKTEGFRTDPSVRALVREVAKADPYGFAGATNQVDRELLEPAARVVGIGETQSEARMLKQTLTRAAKGAAALTGAGAAFTLGGAPALTVLGAGYGTSLLGQTPGGARFLFGQNEWQKALNEAARKVSPFLGGIGQSVSGE